MGSVQGQWPRPVAKAMAMVKANAVCPWAWQGPWLITKAIGHCRINGQRQGQGRGKGEAKAMAKAVSKAIAKAMARAKSMAIIKAKDMARAVANGLGHGHCE